GPAKPRIRGGRGANRRASIASFPCRPARPVAYKLEVKVLDRVSGQTVSRQEEFRSKPQSRAVGKRGAPVLTFFAHEKADWRALKRPRLEFRSAGRQCLGRRNS